MAKSKKTKPAKKPKIIRALRHWKQQFDKNAVFVCRRSFKWDDIVTEIGEEIPEGLFKNKAKLEYFWKARWIELGEFESPEDVKDKAKTEADEADSGPEQAPDETVSVPEENSEADDEADSGPEQAPE